jgi:thioredoxin-related protein
MVAGQTLAGPVPGLRSGTDFAASNVAANPRGPGRHLTAGTVKGPEARQEPVNLAVRLWAARQEHVRVCSALLPARHVFFGQKRGSKVKRWSISLLLLAIALSITNGTAAAQKFEWRDWNSGIAEAKKTGRPVLVDVYTDWCGWCKRMDRDVYSSKEVRDYLGQAFVTIKLDAEASDPTPYQGQKLTARALAGRSFRVTGYPTTVFLASDGKHLVNVPGYVPAPRFLTLLQYIGEGHFERGVPFEKFAQEREKKD